MRFEARLQLARDAMRAQGFELLVGFHNGVHFIEKPDPVLLLSRFKALAESAVFLRRDGEVTLVVTPAWDAPRAARYSPGASVIGTHDLAGAVAEVFSRYSVPAKGIGLAGLSGMRWEIEARVRGLLGNDARSADDAVFRVAQRKTAEEISRAETAARIASLGYERLLEIARPGIAEDWLAAQIKWYTKTLGAEDNFLILTAGPRNPTVHPSRGRPLEAGDLLLAEITPSVAGQMAQVCRTAVLGASTEVQRKSYEISVRSMRAGIGAAVPGRAMGGVSRAINAVMEEEGYGEYCYPPHIRRRGHGLGFASPSPGDVSIENATILEPDMLFVVHPNQNMPQTGYLLCGDTVVVTEDGARELTRCSEVLDEIPI